MSAIGADLPPHLLAKRKRQQEEEEQSATTTSSGAKRSASPDEPEKRRRVIGPAMPPTPLDEIPERPPKPQVDDSSDDDDDFGPALPTGSAVTSALNEDEERGIQAGGTTGSHPEEKLKRDDWMMMPPKQDDLAARLDPTKQRPTKFNTGKGARGQNNMDSDSSTWHETPEQKQKRLQDEILGISKPSPIPNTTTGKTSKLTREDATNRKVKEQLETMTRATSLLEQHQKSKGAEAEDDPSKRAFDREKDMASSSRISSSQKRQMLNKASDFSGKFSGGSYL
ncbi:hypothetical protein DOTSEDRAFT_57415 [Dothistroma septosporum NZE10]|uniref:DUF3752 domain-containing protein n=1 Tax=Dothistroma septosporum (strain NZE10 / CBS 128990) TaxID=675120 RepID=N1PC00_DOTSN|nr:hypothetical protein DOTSEDRAFT_57415 [Dothistroma septosporum NZE10]